VGSARHSNADAIRAASVESVSGVPNSDENLRGDHPRSASTMLSARSAKERDTSGDLEWLREIPSCARRGGASLVIHARQTRCDRRSAGNRDGDGVETVVLAAPLGPMMARRWRAARPGYTVTGPQGRRRPPPLVAWSGIGSGTKNIPGHVEGLRYC